MNDNSVFGALRLAVASHYDNLALEQWHRLVEKSAVAGDHRLDWLAVSKLASANGLGPLLYQAAKSVPAPFNEPLLTGELERHYQVTAAQNTVAMHDITSVVRCLNETGIDPMLLKGAALLNTVYKSPAQRPMFDIDLLVPYTNLEAALTAVAPLGYSVSEPEPFPNLDGLFWNEVLLQDKEGARVNLELHWNLLDIPFYASRPPIATLMGRAQHVDIGKTSALCLAPLDLLLHLCAHNIFHHQGRLWRTEVDVAFVAQTYKTELNWDKLITAAVDHDLVLGVQQTIVRSAEYWRAPVPEDALNALRLLKPTARERSWLSYQRSEFLKVFRTIVTLPSIWHRYHYLRGQLFPTSEYLSFRYDIAPETPRTLAYSKRFWSGIQGLLSELTGQTHVKETKKTERTKNLLG